MSAAAFSDAAIDGVVASRVADAASTDEVREVVRATAAAGEALVATGRGRHLAIGEPPARCDVLLRLARLARIREHHAADMTITVEAGCTLAEIDAALAAEGQWLGLDAPAPEETTVGGLLAANLSGPLRASPQATTSARSCGGRGRTLNVASTSTPSVPSAPTCALLSLIHI